MRALALLPLLLLLPACDSTSDDGPGDTPGDGLRLVGRFDGVGEPADARQASVLLDFGTGGAAPGTSTASLFFRLLDGPGNAIEEVSGPATVTLGDAGALALSCDCTADFRGPLPVQAAGTATADRLVLTFSGGVAMADVVLTKP